MGLAMHGDLCTPMWKNPDDGDNNVGAAPSRGWVAGRLWKHPPPPPPLAG